MEEEETTARTIDQQRKGNRAKFSRGKCDPGPATRVEGESTRCTSHPQPDPNGDWITQANTGSSSRKNASLGIGGPCKSESWPPVKVKSGLGSLIPQSSVSGTAF